MAANCQPSRPKVGSIQCKGSIPSNATLATIAEGVSILWGSIEADLGEFEKERARETLADVFSDGSGGTSRPERDTFASFIPSRTITSE